VPGRLLRLGGAREKTTTKGKSENKGASSRKDFYVLTRTFLIFLVSAVGIFFFTLFRGMAGAGAVTGRVLLALCQEAVAMAFIPAALYVVYRLVRN
jgi:hypothetical protein